MKGISRDNVLLRRLQKLPDNVRQVTQTIVLSLAAGLSAVLFLFMANLMFSLTYLKFAGRSKLFFAIASFALIMTTSLLVGVLLNVLSPEAAGSGIPQVKSAYWKELGYLPFRTVLVKFIAGVLSIGGGDGPGGRGRLLDGAVADGHDPRGDGGRGARAGREVCAEAGDQGKDDDADHHAAPGEPAPAGRGAVGRSDGQLGRHLLWAEYHV